MNWCRAMPLPLVALLLVTGCSADTPRRDAADLPANAVPARIGGFTTQVEVSADKAFAAAGASSLTARGRVWTLRSGGAVRGALQLGVLKPEYDARDIEVRRGVRSNIERGTYRWFKVRTQWVGVQELPELRLYLWFPPRGDLYELLQLQPDVPNQRSLLARIVSYQEES